jgi:hypothetical protein
MVCWNQDSSPVAMPSRSFVSDSCKILNISFTAFLHRLSRTDFVNCPNGSKPVSLPDFPSGNRLSQFTSQSSALRYSRLKSLWEAECIEMGRRTGTFWTPCIMNGVLIDESKCAGSQPGKLGQDTGSLREIRFSGKFFPIPSTSSASNIVTLLTHMQRLRKQ